MSSVKRALVTGGSGGIGAAICLHLARAGHHVCVHTRQGLPAAEALIEQIRAEGGSAELVQFDVTDAQGARAALEALAGPI